MKKMIALLVLAFFGMTATCGMTFAAEANNGMATANEQALQDPATHQQKKAPHADVGAFWSRVAGLLVQIADPVFQISVRFPLIIL